MSMTGRLMLSYLSVTFAILLALGIPLGVFFRALEVDRLAAGTERDAVTLATLVEDDLERSTPVDAGIAERYAQDTGARVVVTDDAGISVLDTGAPADRDLSTRPEIEQALAGTTASGTRRSETLDDDLLYVAVPVASGGETHGAVRITLGTRELDERVNRFWLGGAGVAALALVLAAAVGWTMARWVSRPVRHLATTADRFATGDLSPEPEQAAAPSEVARLQRRMNEMAARLDAQLARQRAFVADASHQLRTPLTALRLRLENTQERLDALRDEGPQPSDTAEQRAEVAAAVAEVDRLSELVAGLLRLARAEQGGGVTPEVADLGELSRDRVDTWAAVADAEGVTLSYEGATSGVEALAVRGAVEQVLDNLIDNAVAAVAPQGGHVWLRVGRGPEGPWLTVADDGPGLDDVAKARAVDRFWRGDHQQPGTGLGLPIVQELLHAAGGHLVLADAPEGGLEVTAHFRAAP